MEFIERTIAAIAPIDRAAIAAAEARQLTLTKPPGALGMVEQIGNRLAGIAGTCPPPVPERPMVAVFAGDHGVVASGVTPWPQEVTAQMVANFAGGGAAINVVADGVGARVAIVDVGVATDAIDLASLPNVTQARVRAGTADLAKGAAMSVDEARTAIEVGVRTAERLIADGADLLVAGEMGIGNTTPSACLIGALTGRGAVAVTGRGTGIDDEHLARKVAIVEAAIARCDGLGPIDVLAEVGGLEIAALVGFMLGGAAGGVPVVIDGVICGAAMVVAARLCPDVVPRVFAGHRSVEPGASVVLADLGLEPVLDLALRLGEGTGGVLAVPIIQASARILRDMATFGDAGVGEAE